MTVVNNKIWFLETKMKQKESLYIHQIESLHSDYESKLQEKEDTIEFLRTKVSQTVKDLQKEVSEREGIINSRVSSVRKQREEDLKTFIESKEDIERQMKSERTAKLKK